ncbi:cyclase family protein [Brevibacterium epidermidis]|uniref:cyclase family protein n=1 Tax=Brevibacterium epidermidis TaxID=1698 RepID=UPI0035138038
MLAALRAARHGEVFGLDYSINAFSPGMSATRRPAQHTIFGNHPAHRDDYLDAYYLQASSQVDGLRHRRADDSGFYGGTPDHAVTVGTPDLGVQVWAESPLVTRGVLIDLDGFARSQGQPIDHIAGEQLEFEMIRAALEAQNVQLSTGDVVMLHTGWAEWFLALEDDRRKAQRERRRSTGIVQSEEFVDWAWDNGLAMVAADNFAVECLPVADSSPFKDTAVNDNGMMHQVLLAKLGLPLGELWKLNPLALRMRELGQWDTLLTVKPLNVVGGTGSPANAIAIL